ncbi:hypothetical protein JCM3775_001351 [Rhodotorula graminis]
MADSPRRNTQANRQARRAQPYARPSPAPEPEASTPSRLRSLLSYVSPFRSARKRKEPSPAPPSDDDSDDHARIKDEHDSAEDDFALHGKVLTRSGDFTDNVPASPSPWTGSSTQRSIGSSLASSATMPNLAVLAAAGPSTSSSNLTTPHLPGALRRSPSHAAGSTARYADVRSAYAATSALESSSTHATQELARFFQDKADRGEDRLSAVEQAGVFQLMQRAQAESSLPTAFTPNFRSASALPPAQSVASSSSSSVFGGPASVAGSAIPSSAAKRRRPIYVGAGYSSRRRRATTLGLASTTTSTSSLSDAALADGKRRRTATDRGDEDDIPLASLDDMVASPSRFAAVAASAPASPARTSMSAPASVAPKPRFGGASGSGSNGVGASASTSTPAKPSPLWQVSGESATPTPPRGKAAAPAPSSSSSSTRAADLVLEVIRQDDAARKKALPVAATAASAGKGAILNPYAGEENPLAMAGRVGRKDKAILSPPQQTVESPKPKQRVDKVVAEVGKLKDVSDVSPLEQLERTMPAEYRRETKRTTKPASPPPAPKPEPSAAASAPAPATAKSKGKKAVAVVTLSSEEEGDEEEEEREDEGEDEEMGSGAEAQDGDESEEYELDDDMAEAETGEEEQEEDTLPTPPAFAPAAQTPSFSFGASSLPNPFSTSTGGAFSFGSATYVPSSQPAFSFGASTSSTPSFSFAPSSASTAAPARAPSGPSSDDAQALLAFSGAGAGAPQQRPLTPQEANIPPEPPVFPAPSSLSTAPSPFSFGAASSSTAAAPAAVAGNSADAAQDPQAAARALPRRELDLSRFSFAGIGARASATGSDKALEAVKDLVKGMSRSELPTFSF